MSIFFDIVCEEKARLEDLLKFYETRKVNEELKKFSKENYEEICAVYDFLTKRRIK